MRGSVTTVSVLGKAVPTQSSTFQIIPRCWKSWRLVYARTFVPDDRLMRVAIVGSRGYLHYYRVLNFMFNHLPDKCEIVSGGAVGIDSAAKHGARVLSLEYTEFLPQYMIHGRKAPLLRNISIAKYCDRMVAFWDEESRGTKHSLAIAKSLGRPFIVINSSGDVWSNQQK